MQTNDKIRHILAVTYISEHNLPCNQPNQYLITCLLIKGANRNRSVNINISVSPSETMYLIAD